MQTPPRDGLLFADALADATAGPAPIAASPLPPLAATGKALPVTAVAAVAAVAVTELPVTETIAPVMSRQAPLDEPVPTEPPPTPMSVGQMPKAMPIVERSSAKRQPARDPAPEPETQHQAAAAASVGVPLSLDSTASVVAEAVAPPVIPKPDPLAPNVPTAATSTDTDAMPAVMLSPVVAPIEEVANLPPSAPSVALDRPEASIPTSITAPADHVAPALIAPRVSVPAIAGDQRSPPGPTADGTAPATPQRHMVQAARALRDPLAVFVPAAPDRPVLEGTEDAPARETPNHHAVVADVAAPTIAEKPVTISPLFVRQIGDSPSVPSIPIGEGAHAAPATILGNVPLTTVAAPAPAEVAQPRQPTMVPSELQVLPPTPEPAIPAQDMIAPNPPVVVDRAAARAMAEIAPAPLAVTLTPPPGVVAAPASSWRSPVLRAPIDEPGSPPTPAVDSVDTTQALRARINVAFVDSAPWVPPTEAPALDLRAIDPASAAAVTPIDRTAAIHAPSSPAPVATNDPAWIDAMIDRIETLRDTAGGRETRIRLTPDALGAVEVTIRETADGVQVQLTADTPAARALLTEAAPRLSEMADARGLKLGQSDAGAGQQSQQGQQRASPEPQRTQSNRSAGGDHATDTDERIA